MTGGGLYVLVAYGSQNVILSGNPDYTNWYLVLRKSSHFSIESATLQVDGPNELFFDESIQIRAKIQRIGDLLSELYFTFTLPDIYSKFVSPGQRNAQYEFQWCRYIGAQIIQKATFLVGGTLVQEFDSDYIIAQAQLDQTSAQFAKWRELVGDIPDLYDPANGSFSGAVSTGALRTPGIYPNVIPVNNTPVQTNAPSIYGRDITVPLGFWFSQNPSLALPLVALQYHECEVQLQLRPIQSLYTILDPSGSRVAPLNQLNSSPSDQRIGNVQYLPTNEEGMYIRNFLTDFGYAVPTLNTWPLNPRLQATYVYLTDEERQTFVTKPLDYLVRQLTTFRYDNISSRQFFNLYTQNPVPRILILPRRTDSVLNRNQWTNYTNWWKYPTAPYIPGGVNQNFGASGLLVAGVQEDIVQFVRVLCDGNEIQEQKPLSFFNTLTPWKYATGSVQPPGLILYSFSLESSNMIRPSGSLNSSRVRNFQLDIAPYPLMPGANYQFNYVVYVETYNFFHVEGGMGGMKFNA